MKILCNLLFATLLLLNSITLSGQNKNLCESGIYPIPKEYLLSTEKLSKHLVSKSETEEQKVYAIYNWICDNIKYNYKTGKRGFPGETDPEKILKIKKTTATGYANLFMKMCNLTGIECFLVAGHTNHNYRIVSESVSDHVWNAVKTDGTWKLIDVTWASGSIKPGFHIKKYKKNRNDSWYEMSPEMFIYSHLPEDPMWQLLDNPVTMKVFLMDDSKINKYLTEEPAYFSFSDSILKWKKYNSYERQYYSGVHAYDFNRKNDYSYAIGNYSMANGLALAATPISDDDTSKETYKTYEKIAKYYEKALKHIEKVISPNNYIKQNVAELNEIIQLYLIQIHMNLGKINYNQASDSSIFTKRVELKILEKKMLKNIKIAEKFNTRLGLDNNFNLVRAEYFYNLGTIIGNTALLEENISDRKKQVKKATEYLKKALLIYKSDITGNYAYKISAITQTIDELKFAAKENY